MAEATVSGILYTGDGKPFAGMSISVHYPAQIIDGKIYPEWSSNFTSAPDGKISFKLPQGAKGVKISGSGFNGVSKTIPNQDSIELSDLLK
jgi:hypothetical protein